MTDPELSIIILKIPLSQYTLINREDPQGFYSFLIGNNGCFLSKEVNFRRKP